jgi:hypothetical protein
MAEEVDLAALQNLGPGVLIVLCHGKPLFYREERLPSPCTRVGASLPPR